MADPKSAKRDHDFGLSPDDPLSKLANLFDLTAGPSAPEAAHEPSIDMEQELLPTPEPVPQAPVSAWQQPAWPQGGQVPNSPEPAWPQEEAPPGVADVRTGEPVPLPFEPRDDGAVQVPEAHVPGPEADAQPFPPAGQWQDDGGALAGPDNGPVSGADASDNMSPVVEMPGTGLSPSDDHVELDVELADETSSLPLDWHPEPVSIDEPLSTVQAMETAHDDMAGDIVPPAWNEGGSPAGEPAAFAGHVALDQEPSGLDDPLSSGSAMTASPASPVAQEPVALPDNVLDEMMTADLGRDAPAATDDASQDHPVAYGGAQWREAAAQSAPAVEPLSAFDGDDHAEPDETAFSDPEFESEVAAFLAGETDGGEDAERSEGWLAETGAPSHVPQGMNAGLGDERAEAAPKSYSPYEASYPERNAPQLGRQTNFGWTAPVAPVMPPSQSAWSAELEASEAAGPAPAPEAPETAYVSRHAPGGDHEPAAHGQPHRPEMENASDTAGFHAARAHFAHGDAPEAEAPVTPPAFEPAAIQPEETPASVAGDDEQELELPDFDESAFLDQTFVDDELRVESHDAPEPQDASPASRQADDDVAFDLDPELLAEIESIQMDEPGGYPDEEPYQAYSGPDDVSADTPAKPAPVAMTGAGLAGAAAAVGGMASRFGLGRKQPVAEPAPPEIDTVAVPEGKVELADDLDLPDVRYQDERAPLDAAPDDLEDLFAGEGLSDRGAGPSQPREGMDFESYFERELEDAGISFGERPGAPPQSSVPLRPHPSGAGEPPAAISAARPAMPAFDDAVSLHDDDLERELSFDEFERDVEEKRGSNRGLLIAAVVAGVALVGGIGAFALSGGGDSAGTTQIVRADPEPVKVKPENPGGSKVPNQNRAVYDEAAGAPADTPPSQEKLVSNAETPVDVKRPVRVVAPGPVDAAPGGEGRAAGNASAPVAGAATPAGKSEDRIDPAEAAEEPGPSRELAAVAPRRVRTYVVRPDGTLVAKEPAAEAQAAEPAATSPAATAAAADATEPAAGESAEPAEPVAGTVANVPVPQPRPEFTPPAGSGRPGGDAPVAVAAAPEQAQTGGGAADAAREPALQPRQVRTTTIRRDSVAPPPVVPGRPADQPVNIVGTTRQDGQQTARAAPAPAAEAPAAASPAAWVQIASHPSRELAQASYRNLSQRYGGIIGGRGVNIVPADIPGRGTFYRVNIPAGSFNEAASLCRQIKAAGGDCLAKR